jgi:hypothetical protein
MKGHEGKGPRLVALCMMGALAFNFPILAIFNKQGFVLGIPLLYAYIFFAWALLIAAMALVVERGNAP